MRTKFSISPVARHQIHRGFAPQDERLFAARQLSALRAAALDQASRLGCIVHWDHEPEQAAE
jgi:hypothetical protein